MSDTLLRSVRPAAQTPRTCGRERETARLVATVERPPSLLVVEGEAGVGKSRLLRDLADHPRLDERRVLSGRCFSVGDPFPLGVLMEALRRLAEDPPAPFRNPVSGALTPLLPELSALLPEPPEPLGDPLARLHVVARAIRTVLSDLGPAILILDDFHCADEQTLSVVATLLDDLPQTLSVVLAYRREDLPASSPIPGMVAGVPPSLRREVVTLRPLRTEDVRTLVAEILGHDGIPDAFLDSIMASTSGLPFAVEEVLRFLAERGDLGTEEAFHAPPRRFSEELIAFRDSVLDEAPAMVRDFVLGRLERVSPATRELLRAASIPEPPVEASLLREVSGLRSREYEEGLGEALSAGLLEEVAEGLLQFRHGFTRVAIHRGLPGPEHRRLHLRTARAIRAQGLRDANSIAYHFREAGDRPSWVRYGERAADRAVSLGNDGWAARMLQELMATEGLPRATRIRLAVKLGEAALHGLAHREAIVILRDVAADASLRPGVRGEIRLWLARLLLQAGAVAEYRAEAETAAGELSRRPELAAISHAFLGVPVLVHGHVEDQRRALERIRELLPEIEDPVIRRRLMVDRATFQMLLGDPAGWSSYREVPRGGSSVEERRQELRLDINAGHAALYVGHYRRARVLAERTRRYRDDPMFAGLACWADSLDIWSRFAVGHWEGLEARIRATADRHPEVPLAVCHLRVIEGLLVMACCSPAEAEPLLDGAFEEAQRLGSAPLMVISSGALAWVRLRIGADQGALEPPLIAAEVLRRKGAWIWGNWLVSSAVPALTAAGRIGEAWDLIDEMDRGVAGLDTAGADANLALARGIAARADGDPFGAAAWLERSERGFRDLPTPYGAAWAMEERGAALADVEPERAAEALVGALEEFRRHGAVADANRVARRLRALGVSVPRPWRGGRRGYGLELSPREREVVRLVSEGMTNREIGRALSLSPRTVGHHVSNAMRKVGVPSRAALGVAVLEAGAPDGADGHRSAEDEG